MGGRRPDKRHRQMAGAYSVEHVNFWHGDPRIATIKPTSAYLFFRLGLISVSEKSEKIGKTWCTNSLSRILKIDRRHIKTCLDELRESGLIGIDEKGDITVYGVRKRHMNLSWNERGHNSLYGQDIKNGRKGEHNSGLMATNSASSKELKTDSGYYDDLLNGELTSQNNS